MRSWTCRLLAVVVLAAITSGDPARPGGLFCAAFADPPLARSRSTDDPSPPAAPVKLIFIHHSTGGNWLADPTPDQPSGGLARALTQNNYFVSATNYGWGPEGIGDRTDIPNWVEWFAGPNSATLSAVFSESGQNVGDHGAWSRAAADPGGENQVVLFKSCFPNSDLNGAPNDPPAPETNDQLTVGNAKAVYNRLLACFAARPDKLFVVITAPPLSRGETAPDRAANARAFNNWLVRDWLKGYAHPNVAVFDYYNVLTSNGGNPDTNDVDAPAGNHHRWRDGAVQHSQTVKGNFSAYPSGDSHPTSAGHRKATAEFVPLLNVFYHRWKAGPGGPAPATGGSRPAPPPSAAQAPPPAPPAAEPAPLAPPVAASPAQVINDFEGQVNYHSEAEQATVVVSPDNTEAHGGRAALRIRYDVKPGGYGSFGRSFDQYQDWSRSAGIAFWLHSAEDGRSFTFLVFSGRPGATTPFEARFETKPDSVSGWRQKAFFWKDLKKASWADADAPSAFDPARVTGFGISIGDADGRGNAGTLWLDDIGLVGRTTP